MKIAILHYSNSLIDLNKLFGMQVMELNELRELKEKGVESTLYAKKVIGEHPNVKEIPYHDYDRCLFDLPYYTRFIDMNKDADIFQGNATPLLAVFNPDKTILRFDGPVELPLTENKMVKQAYKRVNYIFVSKYLKEYYLKRYPFIPIQKCHVLYNAVNHIDYPSKKFNQKIKLLYCSRWVSDKGINVLYKALKLLEIKRDDYEVIIAGGVHRKHKKGFDIEHEENIRKKFEEIKHVKVIGYVPHDKLTTLFNDVDLVVFPSLWDEPFGLVPVEAAMASVPTIAFGVGALHEVIESNKTGVLIKKHKWDYVNARRLAKAIEGFVDNRQICNIYGCNARKRVVEKFNWRIYTERLMQIYQAVSRED